MSLNLNMLERIVSVLEAEPLCLEMEHWVSATSDDSPESRMTEVPGMGYEYQKVPSCGTVGCISGWACILNRQDLGLSIARNLSDWYGEGEGDKILGVNCVEGKLLFYTSEWPDPYRSEYRSKSTPEGRTEITIALLKEVIKRGKIWWA